jgi:catechol 2,3-dioxygenase-like lactoylglutathione lyase family enzyme
MRLDHIAYRTIDRWKTAQFFIDAFGYKTQTEFDLEFDDDSTTKCIALEPSEKTKGVMRQMIYPGIASYHLDPEIFVSDGSSDSIVGKWVAERGNIGGIHHLAYEVSSVEETMREWQAKGWATFASTSPLECPGLVQVFTTPHELTGVVYEFIERRGEYGFCAENVKQLMLSTKDL